MLILNSSVDGTVFRSGRPFSAVPSLFRCSRETHPEGSRLTRILQIAFIAAFLVSATILIGDASACNVCHSKNPKMVKMHEELGFKDCFNCHNPFNQKTDEERKAQMTSDQLCINCHAPKSPDKPKAEK
ncbi:MAG: hypothetical protein HZA17_10235 [Nitrospirae bacterium]|nr:hypothetical protein [Nitrospirota bacterium]